MNTFYQKVYYGDYLDDDDDDEKKDVYMKKE